jgi:hypothetical protein
MPHKKPPSAADRAALILKARAGLAFACGHVDAELFAATSRIGHTVKAYAKLHKHGADDRAITEMLVDLRHYCDRKELMFDELNTAAGQHYQDAKADLETE